MNSEKLMRSNLIGRKIQVGNIHGKIVDESKNMLTIDIGKKEIKIIKKTNQMEIDGIEINGEKIIGNIEERVRKKR